MRGTALAAAVLLAAGGCTTTGLSPREVRGQDYASCILSMYAPPEVGSATTKPSQLVTPTRIAVAQLGEVAPPQAMLEALRKSPSSFASVTPIPGSTEAIIYPGWQAKNAGAVDPSPQKLAVERVDRMRRYARDLGANYLFLYGGTVDKSDTDTPLTLANLTIVGAFVVPSEKLRADARASGSLIDVATGRVVLAVSADGRQEKLSPSVAKKGDELQMLESLRDEVVAKLASQLTERVAEESRLQSAGKDEASQPLKYLKSE